MPHSTQDFLTTIGAEALSGAECQFADEPTRLEQLDAVTTLIPLSHYRMLSVRGVDAEKFLQGQLTCSAADVSETVSAPGAHCTPKGRIISSFQLLRPAPDQFWLRMRADLLDSAQQALAKYAVFSKAKLEHEAGLVGIGLRGSDSAAMVRRLSGDIPGAQHATRPHSGGMILQRDVEGSWFECWLPQVAALQLWQQWHPQTTAAGTRYWHWLTIRAGLAEVSAASSDQFIPQMLAYHLTGAVNFKKGCYTGQEIVARAYYRGQVKRHLVRATLDSVAPEYGTAVHDAGGRAIGTVVSSIATAPGQAELLAVCGGDEAETALSINGAKLRPEPLPYAIP